MLGGIDFRALVKRCFVQLGIGAVPRSWNEKVSEIEVGVGDFGIVGDGRTDNGDMLMAMNAALRTMNLPVRIKFAPGGVYHYSRVEWLKGIRHVIVDARGASFKNIKTAPSWSFQTACLGTNYNPFNTVAAGQVYSGASTFFGHLINTVAAAGLVVRTTTVGDAANYAAGNRVLVYGWGQQDASFPPSPRFFEWNEVESVNAGTGDITLKHKLRYEYESRWHDFDPGKGAPRIINLDRGNEFTWGDYFEWNGGTFIEVGGNNNAIQIEGYRRAVLRGVTGPLSYPSICESMQYIDCKIDYVETDKIIDSIVFDGGEYETFVGGTGANIVTLTGGIKITDNMELSAKHNIIDGAILSCQGSGSATTVIGANVGLAIDKIDIRSARVIPKSTTTALINGANEKTFTVASVSSGLKVLVAAVGDAGAEPIFQSLKIGRLYQLQNGSKFVRPTKIYREDVNNVAIEGEWSVLPIAAEVYRAANVGDIITGQIDIEGQYAAAFRAQNFPRAMRQQIAEQDGRHFFRSFTEKDITRQATGGVAALSNDWYVRARLIRVFAFIDVAYTGGSAIPQLAIKGLNTAATTYALININTTGAREVSVFGTNGAVAGDTLSVTNGDYCEQFQLVMTRSGGFFPDYASALELPKFRIVAQFLQA